MTSPFMTSHEVARIFRVDPKTVSRWRWPEGSYIRTPGGHFRYRRDWVIDMIERGEFGSVR